MTHTCVHQQRQEFNADCIFCQELRQKEGENLLNASDELFGEVISSYPDAQALEDGVLVELRSSAKFQGLPINRMTGHLFDDLLPSFEAVAAGFDGELSPAIASILRTKCAFAEASEGNTGGIGDIYRIPPKLWLVRNEVGGWTAMYPEDY